MTKKYITQDLELYDILSAFPNLKEVLLLQKIDINKIVEGETFKTFLEKEKMTENEIEIFIKKINDELNIFLYKESLKPTIITEKKTTVFTSENEHLEEE